MKFWKDVIDTNMSFAKAEKQIRKYRPYYSTRPSWEGVHFYSKNNQYCILLKDGTILEDVQDDGVWNKDKNDWMIVTITDEAVKLLEGRYLI